MITLESDEAKGVLSIIIASSSRLLLLRAFMFITVIKQTPIKINEAATMATIVETLSFGLLDSEFVESPEQDWSNGAPHSSGLLENAEELKLWIGNDGIRPDKLL
ncbi:hypothetical protein HanRHA438_Chr07g0292801 [Helianthus annuus]|nr:hypothetical protein HanLR1_Chr07g0231951 [Helianthus annuus]KAJ0730428.1 hypothetical protein HanOQP8_Chr07g0239881 [Helianthus annuus]KAJ0770121.1 hypothetical protein HanPI659440_Chr07g0253451 [Helianthus annuus]KAJ0906921.1 hypothetical protein HanRHA438_Chr07g0292801 [Helianthus annuus]